MVESIVFVHGVRLMAFDRPWSTITMIASYPSVGGRSVMKSTEHWENGVASSQDGERAKERKETATKCVVLDSLVRDCRKLQSLTRELAVHPEKVIVRMCLQNTFERTHICAEQRRPWSLRLPGERSHKIVISQQGVDHSSR